MFFLGSVTFQIAIVLLITDLVELSCEIIVLSGDIALHFFQLILQ